MNNYGGKGSPLEYNCLRPLCNGWEKILWLKFSSSTNIFWIFLDD